MSASWTPPPRRSGGSIKPLKHVPSPPRRPARSRRDVVFDRFVIGLVLCLYIAAIIAIASHLSGK